MTELIYRVPTMHCSNCERSVKRELAEVASVESVEVDLDANLVLVRGDDLVDADLRAAIEEAGYKAEAV